MCVQFIHADTLKVSINLSQSKIMQLTLFVKKIGFDV